MKRIKRKETRSKKRHEESAVIDEKDLITPLPLDLKLQILVRLPAKSIAKFNFVSKPWSSIVRGKDLTELFISRSSTRPSFLFILESDKMMEFHSYSQGEPFSRHHRHVTSITLNRICNLSSPIHGLICGHKLGNDDSMVICNPSTGQFVTLPRVKRLNWGRQSDNVSKFLGYDPVNDVYKVLCMIVRYVPGYRAPVISQEHQVFTLGASEKAWRMIECKHPHFPAIKELCKDGVIYYGAWYNNHHLEGSLIVSFDVRSEEFGVIKLPECVKILHFRTELVNYHGNIALVDRSFVGNVNLWVLQDAKKHEWSKISVLLPDIAGNNVFCFRGTISTGEIIFAPYQYANPFFLLYYDLKRKHARRVDVDGVRDRSIDDPIKVFMDHVESHLFLEKEV